MEQQSKQMNVTSYKTENIGSLQPNETVYCA